LLPKSESWRYAEIPGFEVLSCASASATKHFLRDFQQLQLVIDIVWPALRQASHPVPASLVLYGGGREPLLMDSVKMSGDDVIELQSLELPAGARRTASVFYANEEAACIVVDLDRPTAGMDDPYRQFYREYVSHLFSQMDVRAAPWLREGVARLFAGVDFTDKWIRFGAVDGDRPGDFNTMLGRKPMPSLRGNLPVATPREPLGGYGSNVAAASRPYVAMGAFPSFGKMLAADEVEFQSDPYFRYLAHAFVHMCLYGRGQHYQKPFLTYLARTNGGPGSEEVFRECFGMSHQAMRDELVGYVSFTDYKSIVYKARKGESLPLPGEVVLRDATQAEVGRIKGQGLLLAGRSDLARVALLAPYLRGQQDADLLAALGLYELDAGKPGRVRDFLELAARGNTKRARAYLELARLRAAERIQAGMVADAPPAAVIGPLRRAAALEPPLIAVYEFMASEWLRCGTPPPAADLALLEKGAVRFQRKLKLVYDTAHLHAAGGLPDRAARLAEWGARHAQAPADRERFAKLLATLPGQGAVRN
jgi:hypothetical protein